MIDDIQLAEDILTLALVGGMPASYWLHDQRIARACEVLAIAPADAERYSLALLQKLNLSPDAPVLNR